MWCLGWNNSTKCAFDMLAINQIRQSTESENVMATTDNNKAAKKPASGKSPAENAEQPRPKKEDKEKPTAIFPGDVSPEAT
jgi:hypothetical protein